MIKDELYHYTSYHHLMEIIVTRKLKLTNSNLLFPANPKVEDGRVIFGTDQYKPVVWLTSRETPENIGIHFDDNPLPTEYDKRRIRITIPNVVLLGIRPWDQWAKQNNMDRRWWRALTTGMDYRSWYIAEHEIPLSAASQIVDLFEGIEYTGWK